MQNLIIRLPGLVEPVGVVIPDSPGYRSIGLRLDGQRLTVLVDCEVLEKITIQEELSTLNVNGQTVTIFNQPVSVR